MRRGSSWVERGIERVCKQGVYPFLEITDVIPILPLPALQGQSSEALTGVTTSHQDVPLLIASATLRGDNGRLQDGWIADDGAPQARPLRPGAVESLRLHLPVVGDDGGAGDDAAKDAPSKLL